MYYKNLRDDKNIFTRTKLLEEIEKSFKKCSFDCLIYELVYKMDELKYLCKFYSLRRLNHERNIFSSN